MININDFKGLTDSDKFDCAMKNIGSDGIVIIPPRQTDVEPDRSFWLIDRAILIPENTTLILQNCTIKLSDKCRDNFFRSENCGLGIEEIEPLSNIHIRGDGLCILQGADHPRAVGDGSKMIHNPCPKKHDDLCRLAEWIPEERRKSGKLDFWDEHAHSYGTDAGKEGESQYGDWRGIGILFARVSHFSIENLRIVEPHGWAISCEDCSNGRIEKIDLDSCMAKEIDGMLMNMENQDGIDLRNGCHDIVISDITGGTGDDVIALTAIADEGGYIRSNGAMCSTQVMHNDWSKRSRDIHDIIIRNVTGYSKGRICFIIRLLPVNAHIWNVVIDGIVDNTPDAESRAGGVLLLGECDSEYGKNPLDGMRNIMISNVSCNSHRAIVVPGYLSDSVITNVINRNPDCPVIDVDRVGGLKNVLTNNLFTAGIELIREKESDE